MSSRHDSFWEWCKAVLFVLGVLMIMIGLGIYLGTRDEVRYVTVDDGLDTALFDERVALQQQRQLSCYKKIADFNEQHNAANVSFEGYYRLNWSYDKICEIPSIIQNMGDYRKAVEMIFHNRCIDYEFVSFTPYEKSLCPLGELPSWKEVVK